MAMVIGIRMLLLDTSSLMIIHLGAKPVRGGSPPKDIRMIKVIEIRRGNLFHVLDSVRVVVFLFILNSENMVIVRII